MERNALSDNIKFYQQEPLPLYFDMGALSSYKAIREDFQTPVEKSIIDLFPALYGNVGSHIFTPVHEEYSTDITEPMKVLALFSGGQAPGGHNVVIGIYDALQRISPNFQLYGAIDGVKGLLNGEFRLINQEDTARYINTGGFHLLGSSRVKIKSEADMQKVASILQEQGFHQLVIIGGDDSQTNAAILAEFFLKNNVPIQVVGVPKTIDGDLVNPYVHASFGFDTSCRVYEELISNLQIDLLSAKKMWAFIRLMGRSASHITLECAVACRPNLAFISEECLEKKMHFSEMVDEIEKLILERAEANKFYGSILIPEGIVEFLEDFKILIKELQQMEVTCREEINPVNLSNESKMLFNMLPDSIVDQLLFEKDPHGNIQVSKIEIERLVIDILQKRLKGKIPFSPQPFFFGYEARASIPSGFDASYCYNLGVLAVIAFIQKLTGVMVGFSSLGESIGEWKAHIVPLISLMVMEERSGAFSPVVKKQLVDTKGKICTLYKEIREGDRIEDGYNVVGPLQLFLPPKVFCEPVFSIRALSSCCVSSS